MGSLGWGGTDPLEITSLHHTRHPAEFGRSRSNGASAMEIHLIILNPPSVPPFKVTQGRRNTSIGRL